MKTQVLKIQPNTDTNLLKVCISIADKQHHFTFSRQFNQIANHQLQIINYDKNFGDTFKYNQHIIDEVISLVRKFFKGDDLTLPQEIGDFGTPEEALALQKPFNQSSTTDPESILTDKGLNVFDSQRQEQHRQFVESFYRRIRGHITGTSDHRSVVTGSTQPRRLMPTGYLSPLPAASTVSSEQQNTFRPSNCGLVINLAADWNQKQLPVDLSIRFSVFLPKIDLSKAVDRSLRPMWQRFDIGANISSTIQDLLDNSSTLAKINQDITEQLNNITETHQADSLAWLLGLDQTIINNLTESEVAFAQAENYQALKTQLSQRIANKKRNNKNDKATADDEIKLGQIAPIYFKVQVEAQRRTLGGQTRLRLFLRNKSEKIDSFADPRDTGLFGASLAVKLPKEIWQPIELSRFQVSYQVDSTVPAQGINCTPQSEDINGVVRIWTEFLPIYWQKRLYTAGIQAPFKNLAQANGDADLQVLQSILLQMQEYRNNWQALINQKHPQTGGTQHSADAQKDLDNFQQEIQRFELGIQVLSNPKYAQLRRAFNLMNQTFAEIDDKRKQRNKSPYENWRPFQIVYIVSNLAALAARQWTGDFASNALAQVDHAAVVHFPTGGGKSEAVMGIILTQAFFDRLRGRDWGVVAWLRYPLRLLTYQQLQRFLDTLVVADEIRKTQPDLAKTPEFTVGYYGGRDNSPNSLKSVPDEAQKYIGRATKEMQDRGIKPLFKYLTLAEVGEHVPESIQQYRMVMRCPYCGLENVHTFIDPQTKELRHRCGSLNEPLPQGACGREIPLYIVDEDIYSRLPTLLVGTLDKIANITFRPASRTLFGAASHICSVHGFAANYTCHKQDSVGGCTRRDLKVISTPPVDPGIPLIFQDELHLLREELGTFDGHYEALIDAIHQERGANRPKILAATATIEGAEQQIRHLYWRELSQFPVRGPAQGRSFYANEHSLYITRGFVGLRPTAANALDATMALILALRTELEIIRNEPTKYKVEYGLGSLTDDQFLRLVDEHDLCCTYVNSKNDGSDIRRSINEQVKAVLREQFGEDKANAMLPEAITLSGDDGIDVVKEVLKQMETPQINLKPDDPERLSDVVATSLISHGVDIDRLNLMLFYGWPSTTAEYIQASSRAGRTVPGLVFILFRPQRARERAIFDYFVKAHEYLDQMVEAVPIDRFAHNALYRTAFGLLLGRLLHIDAPAARPGKQEIDIADLDKIDKLRDLIHGIGIGRSAINLTAVVNNISTTINPDNLPEGEVFQTALSLLENAFISQIERIVQDPNESNQVTNALTKNDIPNDFRLLLSLRNVDTGIRITGY
ncbi:helicase-related protein [Nostoc sp. 2RC]|uniref:helicase-related protein n=1 Tax=Nostoc sp. 2RC TaxID=2485484 RepID=UPI001626F602|nr:helicase-related protein [Nostoc sp. 2RC]MBC1238206.1 helicase [Nostoc sp. 2RC]